MQAKLRLFAPLDVASLALFRIAFGAIMLWEAWRYFKYDWIRTQYIEPAFHFTFHGFGWVRPWPGDGMYLHFLVMGAAALFVAVGFMYRLSALTFFLAFTYVFLLEQARYLNHFYLVCLLAFLMIFVPAHRAMSIDALLRPHKRSDDAPAWALWLLRAQLTIVYFYAGVAKLNDDWLHGEPIRMWLAERVDYSLAGGLLPLGRLFEGECAVWFFAYGGLAFDLLVVPALLWRRTRPFAFAAALFFHLTNSWLFDIGVFPWLMIPATTLFFAPDWPRRIFNWPRREPQDAARRGLVAPLVAPLVAAYLAVQVLVPLRHFLYPGVVHWTEEGHSFSWHMKLRSKSGSATVVVYDPAHKRTKNLWLGKYLNSRQIRKMSGRPDLLLQFCHHIARVYEEEGYPGVEVRARAEVSLNGRRRQLLVDPTVDLAAQPRSLLPASWTLPLETPLGERETGEALAEAETD